MNDQLRSRLLQRGEKAFVKSIRVKEAFHATGLGSLVEMTEGIMRAFRAGNRLFLFGNGGSAADAQHIAAELVNRFERDRAPLPAIALTTDTSVLTSIGNDAGFQDSFLRQLQALAREGDVALGISTSGRSTNVVRALDWGRRNGLRTIGWTGARQCALDELCETVIHVPSDVTARIQECHITMGHVLCELLEEMLASEEGRLP